MRHTCSGMSLHPAMAASWELKVWLYIIMIIFFYITIIFFIR